MNSAVSFAKAARSGFLSHESSRLSTDTADVFQTKLNTEPSLYCKLVVKYPLRSFCKLVFWRFETVFVTSYNFKVNFLYWLYGWNIWVDSLHNYRLWGLLILVITLFGMLNATKEWHVFSSEWVSWKRRQWMTLNEFIKLYWRISTKL